MSAVRLVALTDEMCGYIHAVLQHECDPEIVNEFYAAWKASASDPSEAVDIQVSRKLRPRISTDDCMALSNAILAALGVPA